MPGYGQDKCCLAKANYKAFLFFEAPKFISGNEYSYLIDVGVF